MLNEEIALTRLVHAKLVVEEQHIKISGRRHLQHTWHTSGLAVVGREMRRMARFEG